MIRSKPSVNQDFSDIRQVTVRHGFPRITADFTTPHFNADLPLEQRIRKLTESINGQYPRPWMTDLENPSRAEVFIVGHNPATPYRSDGIDYERFIDSLFNRHGEGCRKFYTEITKQTQTRDKIEWFSSKLKKVGVYSILETNVICCAPLKEKPLRRPEKARGREIFRTLATEIRPKAMILCGNNVCEEFRRLFKVPSLPDPPKSKDEFVRVRIELDLDTHLGLRTQLFAFVIRSLGPPEYNKWQKWADEYLNEVSERVRKDVEPVDNP